MKPPYQITKAIIERIASISGKLGEVKALHMDKPSPVLRKRNKVRTIHSSLKIEGNSLTEDQITAILEDKRVIGPREDIMEVKNAIEVYDQIERFNFVSSRSFLDAHKMLMKGLVKDAGKYRIGNVGIVHGKEVAHVAPPASGVADLMRDLFTYLKRSDDLLLVKSCVFHYEVEFIHPFTDGNGRMGRLWQSVILLQEYPVFAYLPFESIVSESQEQYYKALAKSDKAGSSTIFVEYMLGVIDTALDDFLAFSNRTMTKEDRLQYFMSLKIDEFTRKDYMSVFKDISTSTASRDLLEGVRLKLFKKQGDKRSTVYGILGK